MPSFFRRGGAQILRVLESLVAPSSGLNESQVYGLDVSGVTRIFARDSDGAVTRTTGQVVEVELDFGTTPVSSKSFVVVDATVLTTSKITIVQSGATPTGKTAGEAELDPIAASAIAAAGSFTVFCVPLMGNVVGNYKFNYQVGQ